MNLGRVVGQLRRIDIGESEEHRRASHSRPVLGCVIAHPEVVGDDDASPAGKGEASYRRLALKPHRCSGICVFDRTSNEHGAAHNINRFGVNDVNACDALANSVCDDAVSRLVQTVLLALRHPVTVTSRVVV